MENETPPDAPGVSSDSADSISVKVLTQIINLSQDFHGVLPRAAVIGASDDSSGSNT